MHRHLPNAAAGLGFMSDEATVTVTTVLAGLMFLALIAFVAWKARQNRAAALAKLHQKWREKIPWKEALVALKPSRSPAMRTSK